MTKRILAAVLGAGMFIVGTAVDADVGSSLIILGPGAPTAGCASGTCDGTADGTTKAYDVSKVTYIRIQFACTSGPCVGVLTVNGRSRANVSTVTLPWVPLISCTNVTTGGLCADGSIAYVNVPVTMAVQVVQSGTGSGTMVAVLETHQVTP